jgi:hypothetical protein
MVVSLRGLVTKMNWLAVNHQFQSNSDSDSSVQFSRKRVFILHLSFVLDS